MALLGCGSETGPSEARSIVLAGWTRDGAQQFITHFVAHAAVVRVGQADPLARGTAAVGGDEVAFYIGLADLPALQPTDSLIVSITSGECRGLIDPRIAMSAEAIDTLRGDTLWVELTADSSTGRARVALGAFCAAGYDYPNAYASFWVALEVTEIADSIRGSWKIPYLTTRVTESGPFAGVRRGDTLILELRMADLPRCDPGHRLWVIVGPGDVLGEAWFQSLGPCRGSDASFWFVGEDVGWWPE